MKPLVRPGIVALPGVTPFVSATGILVLPRLDHWSPEKISCGRSLVKTSVVDPSLHSIVRLYGGYLLRRESVSGTSPVYSYCCLSIYQYK